MSVEHGVDNLDSALQALLDLGYTGDVVIAGYSQGARVVTIAKMQFANGDWDDLLAQVDSVSSSTSATPTARTVAFCRDWVSCGIFRSST